MYTHRKVFTARSPGIVMIDFASPARQTAKKSIAISILVSVFLIAFPGKAAGNNPDANQRSLRKADVISHRIAAGISTPTQYFFACQGGARYPGSLSFTGDSDFQPNGTLYHSSSAGNHKGCLVGPSSGADFDLYLQKWINSAWVIVASSQSTTSNETISYFGLPGYYRWHIYSYSGSGSYNFWRLSP